MDLLQIYTQVVGLLLLDTIRTDVTLMEPPPETHMRVVVRKVGGVIIQSVYAPYSGTTTAADLRTFHKTVVDHRKALQNGHPNLRIWTMGDMDLRKLAPRTR